MVDRNAKTVNRLFIVALAASILFSIAGCGSGGQSAAAMNGVWNTAYNTPQFGPMTSQLILKDDGTYQKMDTANGMVTLIAGKFQIVANDNLLRLNIDTAQPTQTCGPLGCSPLRYPAAETYNYSLESNTLKLVASGCPPQMCTYTYTH